MAIELPEADNSQPGRADGRVLSGHGGWDTGDYIQVPKGTGVHFYTPHGQVVPDGLGGDSETGAARGRSIEQHNTPGAGHDVVHVPDLNDPALNGHSVTFSQDMSLHELLQENMGDVHFAACRYVDTGGTAPATSATGCSIPRPSTRRARRSAR